MQCTQAILPVAGLGTRFLPWTKVVPKELLPIGNQPIIALLVDECLSIGITDICFVISPGKEAIPQYFAASPALENVLRGRGKLSMLQDLLRYNNVNFQVRYQHVPLGDGHAVLQAADFVQDGVIAVLFGDDLILHEKTGLQQLVGCYNRLPTERDTCVLCLENVSEENVSKYGIVDVDTGWLSGDERIIKIKGLVEKPEPRDAPSTLGIVGKYLIPSSLLSVLHTLEKGGKDGEIRLADAFIAAGNDMEQYGYVLEGTRIDTGTPEGYLDAIHALSKISTLERERRAAISVVA